MTSQMQHDYNIVRNVLKALSIALQATQQARRQRGGGGQYTTCPPIFVLAPPLPDLFLAPTVFFWPEKPFEFVISARKRLGFRRRPFFFFGRSPDFH